MRKLKFMSEPEVFALTLFLAGPSVNLNPMAEERSHTAVPGPDSLW